MCGEQTTSNHEPSGDYVTLLLDVAQDTVL